MKLIKITDKNINKYKEILFNNDKVKNDIIDSLIDTNSYYTQETYEAVKTILNKNNIEIGEIELDYNVFRLIHKHYGLGYQCNKHYLPKRYLKEIKKDLKDIREELKKCNELYGFINPHLNFNSMIELEYSLCKFFQELEEYPSDESVKLEITENYETLDYYLINPKTNEIYRKV